MNNKRKVDRKSEKFGAVKEYIFCCDKNNYVPVNLSVSNKKTKVPGIERERQRKPGHVKF